MDITWNISIFCRLGFYHRRMSFSIKKWGPRRSVESPKCSCSLRQGASGRFNLRIICKYLQIPGGSMQPATPEISRAHLHRYLKKLSGIFSPYGDPFGGGGNDRAGRTDMQGGVKPTHGKLVTDP